MVQTASYLVDAEKLIFTEENKSGVWIHALGLGNFKHPVYGDIDITSERVKNFVESVKNKVRGVDPSINYQHNGDGEAAGWIKDADKRDNGLWLFVEFTGSAITKLKEKAYKYFSAEYHDEWQDASGKLHKDVVFGGALTNRPFMKNLVPINLSEGTVDFAFELIEAITGNDKDKLKGGGTMPLSDEEIEKIANKLSEKFGGNLPTPPNPEIKSLAENPDIKALAEANPLVKGLLEAVELQRTAIDTSAVNLKKAEIARKLAEFDRSKIVLTPTARETVSEFLEKLPAEMSEGFWGILESMKKSSSFLVELGERAGVTTILGANKSAKVMLDEATKKLMSEDKTLSYGDAYDKILSENPDLYRRYRAEMMEEGVNN